MATFGEEIKKLRLERNLSIRETARRSDVSHAYLSQLENNRRKIPTIEILLKISNGLGVSEKEIMDLAGYDKARQVCLHDYEIIEKEVYHDTDKEYTTITGYIMVYCRKCL